MKNKKSSLNIPIISLCQMFLDVLMIIVGGAIAHIFVNKVVEIDNYSNYILTIALFLTIASLVNLYSFRRTAKTSYELQTVIKVWGLSFIISLSVMTLLSSEKIKLWDCFLWFITSAVSIIFVRMLLKHSVSYLRRKGYNTQTVAFIGTSPATNDLIHSFKEETWMGLNVIGFYDDQTHDDALYLGNIAQLIEEAKQGRIDRIYIGLPLEQLEQVKEIIAALSDSTCSVMIIPDIFTMGLLRSNIQEVGDVSIVSVFDTPMNGINRYIKRAEDIVVSSIILLLISPVLLIISLLVKLTSKGPVIFKQKRYGMNGKMISVWKFRSMNVMENGAEVKQAQKDDPRLTPIGGFLRRTSLDELPQFINVFLGDMSIVGPRPHAIVHNEHYRKIINGYMLRHKVKPGITGLAQIKGWRGETDTLEKMEKRVEYDLAYIRNWSLWLDLKIIFVTIFKGFINKSAY